MFRRLIIPRISQALTDTPVVLINGARQVGKTTLVRDLLPDGHKEAYFTFDDASVLGFAKADPVGFIEGLPDQVVLDEVQHVPELFPAIKASVDRNRQAGRFLLTGSSNVLLLPKLSESLAGRMEIVTLFPLAQMEIGRKGTSFIELAFKGDFLRKRYAAVSKPDLITRLVHGGYPEPLQRKNQSRRRAWFESYITSILERDVREMANIDRLASIPRLLSLLAARVGGLLNLSDISSAAKIPYATLHRYIALLEATFLFQPLPAWTSNLGLRFVKSPKTILNDTGLICALLGANEARLKADGTLFGALLENFVVMELRKQATWSEESVRAYHLRTQALKEVDVVLERADGRLVGVEVKAASSVSTEDAKGLLALEEVAKGRLLAGVILYTGKTAIPLRKNITAVPISALWG